MKIIIPLTGGFGNQGGWRVLSEFANHWTQQMHEVYFLVHKTSNFPYFPTVANVLWYDNDGKLVDSNDMSYFKPRLKYIGIAAAMVKALNTLEADVVLATLSLSAFPIYTSTIDAKKVYYIQAYEPFYYKGNSPKQILYRNLSRLSYKLGFLSIVNSPFYFNFKGIKSTRCVYPGIDFNIFKPNVQSRTSSSKKIVLGTIGRIESHKGTQYVLDAFKKLREENGDIELHIAFGDKVLEEIDGVRVIQLKGDKLLSDYYNSLDIYICGGTYDLGAVHYPVIEAMACGIPVVTTGYLPACNDNAWMVSMRSADSIVDKVKEIIENPDLKELKIKKAAQDVRMFDWEKVSREMIVNFREA